MNYPKVLYFKGFEEVNNNVVVNNSEEEKDARILGFKHINEFYARDKEGNLDFTKIVVEKSVAEKTHVLEYQAEPAKETKVCVKCGKEFKPSVKSQKYCSKECSGRK